MKPLHQTCPNCNDHKIVLRNAVSTQHHGYLESYQEEVCLVCGAEVRTSETITTPRYCHRTQTYRHSVKPANPEGRLTVDGAIDPSAIRRLAIYTTPEGAWNAPRGGAANSPSNGPNSPSNGRVPYGSRPAPRHDPGQRLAVALTLGGMLVAVIAAMLAALVLKYA